MVSPLATYLNHFRRKYHNFQLSILNFQFARKCAKQQFPLPTKKPGADERPRVGYVIYFAFRLSVLFQAYEEHSQDSNH